MPKETPQPDELDWQIAIYLSTGMTKAEAASHVLTADYPSGISERTITNRRDKNPEFFNRYTLLIASAFREKNPAAHISRDKAEAEMESLLGAAFSAVRVALANNDTQAALRVIDQFVRKPPAGLEISGGVTVGHKMIWNPKEHLIRQERAIEDSDRLLTALPDDVIEGEVVQ